MPPKKRKSNDYLDQIMDMKRKREAGGQPDDLDEGGVSGDNVGPSFEFSAGSAAEMFSKIMLQASPDDIYGEYLWFVKNLPKMINNKLSDLLHLVRTELGVERVKGLLCGKEFLQEFNATTEILFQFYKKQGFLKIILTPSIAIAVGL